MTPDSALVAEVRRQAGARAGYMRVVRRRLHSQPELSFKEVQTAKLIATRMRLLGYEVRTQVGRTGVQADLVNSANRPLVLVRADMDALPIEEADDGRSYRSRRLGVMHACGHDGHVAIALAVAELMQELRTVWSGRLRFCFQPAEEIDQGAAAMIADGAAEGVDFALGLHLQAGLPVGRVAIGPGLQWAASDQFQLTVKGVGGHAGAPGSSVNPVERGAELVLDLRRLAAHSAPDVLTVTQFRAGTAPNVIAEIAQLAGTLRSFSRDGRAKLKAGLVATASDARIEWGADCPPVVCEPRATERLAACFRDAALDVEPAQPSTASDDMARFLELAPGCYFRVGIDRPGQASHPHHHPLFDIDERALPVAAEALTIAALELLGTR